MSSDANDWITDCCECLDALADDLDDVLRDAEAAFDASRERDWAHEGGLASIRRALQNALALLDGNMVVAPRASGTPSEVHHLSTSSTAVNVSQRVPAKDNLD